METINNYYPYYYHPLTFPLSTLFPKFYNIIDQKRILYTKSAFHASLILCRELKRDGKTGTGGQNYTDYHSQTENRLEKNGQSLKNHYSLDEYKIVINFIQYSILFKTLPVISYEDVVFHNVNFNLTLSFTKLASETHFYQIHYLIEYCISPFHNLLDSLDDYDYLGDNITFDCDDTFLCDDTLFNNSSIQNELPNSSSKQIQRKNELTKMNHINYILKSVSHILSIVNAILMPLILKYVDPIEFFIYIRKWLSGYDRDVLESFSNHLLKLPRRLMGASGAQSVAFAKLDIFLGISKNYPNFFKFGDLSICGEFDVDITNEYPQNIHKKSSLEEYQKKKHEYITVEKREKKSSFQNTNFNHQIVDELWHNIYKIESSVPHNLITSLGGGIWKGPDSIREEQGTIVNHFSPKEREYNGILRKVFNEYIKFKHFHLKMAELYIEKQCNIENPPYIRLLEKRIDDLIKLRDVYTK